MNKYNMSQSVNGQGGQTYSGKKTKPRPLTGREKTMNGTFICTTREHCQCDWCFLVRFDPSLHTIDLRRDLTVPTAMQNIYILILLRVASQVPRSGRPSLVHWCALGKGCKMAHKYKCIARSLKLWCRKSFWMAEEERRRRRSSLGVCMYVELICFCRTVWIRHGLILMSHILTLKR